MNATPASDIDTASVLGHFQGKMRRCMSKYEEERPTRAVGDKALCHSCVADRQLRLIRLDFNNGIILQQRQRRIALAYAAGRLRLTHGR